jgi:hypothetical protein
MVAVMENIRRGNSARGIPHGYTLTPLRSNVLFSSFLGYSPFFCTTGMRITLSYLPQMMTPVHRYRSYRYLPVEKALLKRMGFIDNSYILMLHYLSCDNEDCALPAG